MLGLSIHAPPVILQPHIWSIISLILIFTKPIILPCYSFSLRKTLLVTFVKKYYSTRRQQRVYFMSTIPTFKKMVSFF